MFNSHAYELTKVWRFNENELLQDAHAAANGEVFDFTRYGTQYHELTRCHTNDAVDAINKKWNEHYAKQHTRKKEVCGFGNTKFIIYVGLRIMACKTHGAYKFTNSQELIVKSWTDDTLTLSNLKNQDIEVEMKYTTSF